jgi:bacterioferritin (cytochrome b1)
VLYFEQVNNLNKESKRFMNPRYQYAGLQNVKQPGLSVDECAIRLQALAYAEERLMRLQAAHLVSVPEWDVKGLLGRLQYEDAQHADQLKARLPELRVSKKKAFAGPETPLQVVFDEAMHATNTVELLAGLALVFKPALLQAYRAYLAATNNLADYPTVRLLKMIVAEEEEALTLLEAAYQDGVNSPLKEAEAKAWAETLRALLAAAGGIDGTGDPDTAKLHPIRATAAYTIPRKMSRDDTFPQIWDFLHVENERAAERFAQILATRLSEITAAEGLACVLCEVENQPWPFYVDISRHLWDEVRHTFFGEAAVEHIFGERSAMPIRNFDLTYVFGLTLLQQYAALGLGIEAAMMKYPPGKREEYEFCRDVIQHPLMTTFQDFDWADEVLHVNIARRQLKDWFRGSQQELLALAQQGVELRSQVRKMQPPSPLPDMSQIMAIPGSDTRGDLLPD